MNPKKRNIWNTVQEIAVSKETVKLRVFQMVAKKKHYLNQTKIESELKILKETEGYLIFIKGTLH